MSNSLSADWKSFEKAAAEANRLNKSVVFEALSQAGITDVSVGFDGEGDQGQMERASARTGTETVEFPPVMLAVHISQFGSAQLTEREMSLQDAVEQLCYDYLEQKHGGREINEGSFGEFTFDVATRTITLEFYGRIVDFEHSTDTF